MGSAGSGGSGGSMGSEYPGEMGPLEAGALRAVLLEKVLRPLAVDGFPKGAMAKVPPSPF